ncbi:hypothetical protein L0128_00420 [candidate division KSB1 bacterium]|nr:hypothetical protein [candidate division KSB1 bacterium]
MRQRYFLIIGMLIGFYLGCAGVSRFQVRSIVDNPAEFNNKKVYVRGEVVQVFAVPFLEQGLCKISDGTGEIWVKPAGRVPNKGDHLKVTGMVKVGLTLANKSFGVIIIEDQPEAR